ncbi:MAG: PQQ-binding-like beta-propeller repeat protein [Bacteroidetes bacterium]|nr:PQQ-binding-like beta-propeller repeat protein [Bacteroidota bacterium]
MIKNRKSFIGIFTTIFLLLVLLYINGYATDYKGHVYISLNGGENRKGLGNVAVSDGFDVVLTNAKGEFELSGNPRTRFIFITIPAGYKASGRHYLPVNNNTISYDFVLLPFSASGKKNTRFIQIADTETFEDNGWIDPIRNFARNEEASFIIHTGDICYEKGLNFHGRFLTSETMGVPVFYCIGNHDLVKGDYGEQLFETNFGPVYYSFEAGNTHYIVTPMLNGDYKPSYTKEDVYRWMKNDLKYVDKTKSIVIFNHDLLTIGDQFIYGISEKEKINLNEYNLKAWIYGHFHVNYFRKHGNTGIISVCASPPEMGGIDHSASNFIVYEVNEKGQFRIHPRYNYIDKKLTITTPNGENCVVDDHNQMTISVNVYATSSLAKKVEYQICSSTKATAWGNLAQQTDWNWTTTCSVGGFKAGESLTIKVRACFENGDLTSSAREFVIPETTVQPKPKENWTNLVGNAQHNVIVDTQEKYNKLQLVWTKNTGANIWMASPIYAEGNVFIAAMDEFSDKNYIMAYDAKTGLLRWKYQTKNAVKNNFCYEKGIVMAMDKEAISYGIDAKTGKLKWETDLKMNHLGPFVSGSVTDNGVFYTGSWDYLSALNCNDGKIIWKYGKYEGGEGGPSTLTVANNTLIANSNWVSLYGHDLQSGRKLWSTGEDGLRYRSSTSCFRDDTLFIASTNYLLKMNPITGIYKKFEVPYKLQVAAVPLVTRNRIVLSTVNEGVVAFARASMKEIWKVKTGAALIYTAGYSGPPSATVEASPVQVGNLIVFGASDGYLYVVDKNTGSLMQKIEIGSPLLSTVCITGNLLFVTDFGGNVCCFIMSNS